MRPRVLLGLLVAVAVVLDFVYYTGYFASDDTSYLGTSRQLAMLRGFDPTTSIATTRLAIVVPDALVYAVSGGAIGAIAWFHVVYHLVLVRLAFAIGREVADERVGLVAAAIVATSPVAYLFAGAVLPDLATSVWLALLLLMLLRARRRTLDGPMAAREAIRRYVPAGLVLGVAYSCKETALIMTIPCAAIIMASAPRLRSPVWIRDGALLAGGLLAFVLLELVLLKILTGEWTSRVGAVQDSSGVLAERMATQGTGPIERLDFLWSRVEPAMPITAIVLVVAALAFPALRRRNLAVALFFWWPVVYMTVGTTNFSEYRPSSIQLRYYAIALLPAAVMGGVVIAYLIERWESWASRPRWAGPRWPSGVLVVAVAAITWHEAKGNLAFGGNVYRADDVRAFVAAYEEARARYPQYPIVLAGDYGRRMTPLLYPRAPEGVFAHSSLTSWEEPPRPPLVLLSPVDQALPDGVSDVRPLGLRAMHVRTLDLVYPARRRIDVLVDGARRLFGAAPRPPERSSSVAAVIQLVSPPVGEPPAPFQRLALYVLRGAAAVHDVDGGNHIAWQGERDVVVQLVDRGGYASAPAHPAARIDPPAPSIRIDLDLQLLRGRGATAVVYAFGYDAEGRRVDTSAKQTLDRGSPPSTVSLELASTTPLRAFRIRVRIRSRGRDGVAYVGNPRVSSATTSSP